MAKNQRAQYFDNTSEITEVVAITEEQDVNVVYSKPVLQSPVPCVVEISQNSLYVYTNNP